MCDNILGLENRNDQKNNRGTYKTGRNVQIVLLQNKKKFVNWNKKTTNSPARTMQNSKLEIIIFKNRNHFLLSGQFSLNHEGFGLHSGDRFCFWSSQEHVKKRLLS